MQIHIYILFVGVHMHAHQDLISWYAFSILLFRTIKIYITYPTCMTSPLVVPQYMYWSSSETSMQLTMRLSCPRLQSVGVIFLVWTFNSHTLNVRLNNAITIVISYYYRGRVGLTLLQWLVGRRCIYRRRGRRLAQRSASPPGYHKWHPYQLCPRLQR